MSWCLVGSEMCIRDSPLSKTIQQGIDETYRKAELRKKHL
jgi:hypothetical protein